MKRWLRPCTKMVLSAMIVVVLSGCGARVEPSAAPAAATGRTGPATVTNCGTEVTYERVPQKAVTYDLAMTEQMFSLGLAGQMRGYVIGQYRNIGTETSEYQKELAQVERLGDNRLNVEIVLNAGANWVYAGYNNGFSETRGITPAILARSHVETYVVSETCPGGGFAALDPLEALKADYRNLGKIFGVSARAEEIIADTERRLNGAAANAPATKTRVMLSDVSEDKPWMPGASSIASPVIQKAGATNITDNLPQPWGSVGFETIVARDPEVIFIQDYDKLFEQKRDLLVNNPTMQNVTAVRNGHVYPIDYADTTNGPRVGKAAKRKAQKLRSIGK